MPSVQRTMIDDTVEALEEAGFTVFRGIKDRHDGFRTATRSYIEIARTIERESNNITAGCISGPFTLRLKYFQHRQFVTNSEGECQSIEDMLQLMEQSISQIRTTGMHTKFNLRTDESAAKMNTGITTNYILSGTLSTLQDRGEILGAPSNTVAPVVSGTAKVGETLTVSDGTWIGEPTILYAYQWLNEGVEITGETSNAYIVDDGLLGNTISCNVIASNDFSDGVTKESNGVVIVENVAPTFGTDPVIAGTPEPNQTITATDGIASGDPTPTITGEWYLDAVATGNTTTSYVIETADIDKILTYVNTATNGTEPDATATSNSLTIVSGYVGIGDLTTLSVAFLSTQPATAAYASSGSEIMSYRNGTTAATGTIGFLSNKFNDTEFDTASNGGTESLYLTVGNDQIGSNDFVQTTTSQQPEIIGDGTILYDGVDDKIVSPYSLGNGDNFSIIILGGDNGSINGDMVASQWDDTATGSWFLQVNSTALYRLLFNIAVDGVSIFYRFSVPTYFDGSKPPIIITYDSVLGPTLYANGIEQTLFDTRTHGTVDTLGSGLKIASYAADNNYGSALENGIAMTETTLSAAEVLTINDQWVSNEI